MNNRRYEERIWRLFMYIGNNRLLAKPGSRWTNYKQGETPISQNLFKLRTTRLLATSVTFSERYHSGSNLSSIKKLATSKEIVLRHVEWKLSKAAAPKHTVSRNVHKNVYQWITVEQKWLGPCPYFGHCEEPLDGKLQATLIKTEQTLPSYSRHMVSSLSRFFSMSENALPILPNKII